MRRQWWALVVVAAGVITLTAACGSESEADPTPAASSAAESEDLATASVQRELSVEMRDIAFEPLALTGAAGEVIEIRFQNAGAILHDFTIDEMDADVMEMMGGSGDGVPVAPKSQKGSGGGCAADQGGNLAALVLLGVLAGLAAFRIRKRGTGNLACGCGEFAETASTSLCSVAQAGLPVPRDFARG